MHFVWIDGDEEEDEIDWETSDLKTLVEKISEQLPKKDSHRYTTTLEKVNWESIKFGYHSSEECKKQATKMIKNVNNKSCMIIFQNNISYI